ncbi:MAG: methyltransferase domain-containing protein [Betaproteobacteria bacterium]|nr:methyltransferase domain-containing protein [Betaproteobacteria bacterium]MDH3438030.1 methyltransferase domain-containing protein [Betaproteobacteria bacterium]
MAAGASAGPALAQPSFDVPFVPTPMVVVDEMLRLANVSPDDFVMDLGSGDGRVVITAAKKFGARGIGVELDQHMLIQSEERARQAGVEARVKFVEQDLFKTDLSPATVITMYLFPEVNRRLRLRLLTLNPGTRIVSHDYDLEDWRPDRTSTIRKKVFLWIVPARVAGRWQMRLALPPIERLIEIEFTQRYQVVSGSARLNGVHAPVWEARLTGARLSFILVDTSDRDNEASLYFEGRVAGDAIEGQVTRGVGKARAIAQWRALRVGQ